MADPCRRCVFAPAVAKAIVAHVDRTLEAEQEARAVRAAKLAAWEKELDAG
ncbi:MAG: hypothetical protein ACRD0C_11755 [Acidimicrobiia bacterium]